jgi:molybdenum-dependent DNA-binding transcriptional regulator ModE
MGSMGEAYRCLIDYKKIPEMIKDVERMIQDPSVTSLCAEVI